jgi:hypothetical protein
VNIAKKYKIYKKEIIKNIKNKGKKKKKHTYWAGLLGGGARPGERWCTARPYDGSQLKYDRSGPWAEKLALDCTKGTR